MRYSADTMNAILKPLAILVFACTGVLAHAETPLREIALSINGHQLTAEVAATDSSRTTGLMHRRMMPENRGMLFVFAHPQPQSFWMMNTYLPLSIAYVDEHGVIVNITDMKPLTTAPHPSAKPAKYALEMNQGWFAKRGIKAGTRIDGLQNAPAAQ